MKTKKTFLCAIGIGLSLLTTAQESCDDFTDIMTWPMETYTDGNTIGYSQGGMFPIVSIGAETFNFLNTAEDGIYQIGHAAFTFDGNNQIARFSLYGFYSQFDQMGFHVNGSSDHYLDSPFPITIGDFTIDLDSISTGPTWTYVDLIFEGEIETITIIGFESGITELCVTPIETPDEGCDDFTLPSLWPTESYGEGEIVGYTQGGDRTSTRRLVSYY